jgi:mercuric reductase
MNKQHELLIVGGGAAAFAAATRAADLGTRVTMINAGLPLGGTCVNVGCVPSKFLLENLKHFHEAAVGRDGWLTSHATLDYPKLKQGKDALVQGLRQKNYREVLDALGNVTLVEGRARFTGPKAVTVGGKRFTAERIIIATGARTSIPPVPGLAEAEPLTNITALELEVVPRSIAVIGGGPLGLEFAQIFHRAGANVATVEVMGRILPQHEPEISQTLAQLLADEGIAVKAGRRLVKVEGKPGAIKLYDSGGGVADVEHILAATGVRPNTDGLGLEEIGVKLDKRGFIVIDERQETSVPGIYAAGDVTGTLPLETTAAKQGFNAAHNALTGEAKRINYDWVPHAVFTDPQVASVGWTEAREMAELGVCRCMTLPLDKVPKAHAAGDTRGLVKLVVHPKSRKILGAHALAVNAAEIIHVPLLAMRAGFTLDDLIDTVHVFPTYAEAWKICAQAFDRDPRTMSCCIG